ncbi:MAG: hypothetical protein QF719_11265 [Chloroflexota bacterium]|jgi:hypothetical protein|nr:hypothetical protein [Chloroflexota bacterium]MDP6508007.1 hypothetical protein [Chloroflexota bacterium]MDP6758759.1 hypothetical protein [Chloroflexota bacterium]
MITNDMNARERSVVGPTGADGLASSAAAECGGPSGAGSSTAVVGGATEPGEPTIACHIRRGESPAAFTIPTTNITANVVNAAVCLPFRLLIMLPRSSTGTSCNGAPTRRLCKPESPNLRANLDAFDFEISDKDNARIDEISALDPTVAPFSMANYRPHPYRW